MAAVEDGARLPTVRRRRQMSNNGFPIIDCDTHVLEPAAIWEQYLDPQYRVVARSAFWHETDSRGLTVTLVNGAPARPLSPGGINRQAIWRPGMTAEEIGALDPHLPHPLNPGASDARARLGDMDRLGVQCHILFPTLFAEYFPVVCNPDAAAALARAYNDWIYDFAQADPARLIPVAVLPLQDVSLARRELARVSERGFRRVFVRPAATGNRYPNHKAYAPLWQDLAAGDLTLCFHPSPGSTNPEWTSLGTFVERVAANLRIGHDVSEAVAPAMDNATMLTALCFCGHMEEYPRLRLAFLHGGASWLPLALEKSETYLWLLSAIQDVSLEPADVFFSRPSLVSFNSWESSVARQPDVFANVAAWGSRYPHHDASEPGEALALLDRYHVDDDTRAGLMGGNAARIFQIGS
jgi:predicted TIM-barrel fold metal-dependent hydrolase